MRSLSRIQPPLVTYAIGATSPVGNPGDVVWSTSAGQYLQWRGASWMVMPRLAVAADGAPPAIAAAGSVGNTGYAADAGHTHAHGNQLGGALHALADAVNAGFMSAAQWTVLQSLALGVASSAGAADAGKVAKLDGAGKLSPTFLALASSSGLGALSASDFDKIATLGPGLDTFMGESGGAGRTVQTDAIGQIDYNFILLADDSHPGLMDSSEHKALSDLMLPPVGKITRAWVPNSNVTTFDDRGWGAATWGTLGNQPIANSPSTRFARIRLSTGATTNSGAGVSGALNVQRSASASNAIGGFRYTARLRIQALAATNQWFFCGLYGGGTWTGATLPTAIVNCMGFYARANAVGFLTVGPTTAQQTNTNIPSVGFATLGSSVEVYIEAAERDTTTVTWGIRSLDGAWVTGVANTNLPGGGFPLGPMIAISASTTLAAAAVEVGVQTLQTRY